MIIAQPYPSVCSPFGVERMGVKTPDREREIVIGGSVKDRVKSEKARK